MALFLARGELFVAIRGIKGGLTKFPTKKALSSGYIKVILFARVNSDIQAQGLV